MTAGETDGDASEGDLEISVVEVRGKKRVGFNGLEHLQVDESVKEDLLQRYEDLILALDDVADEYDDGPDRAWHIGRVLDEHDVTEDSDITISDIARYNSIGVNERRMTYCRQLYRFFPDQGYDLSHNVTALGELASRSKGQDREAEAHHGYDRILAAGETLTRRDIFAWWNLETEEPPLETIISEVVAQYEDPANVVASIRRVLLLKGLDPADYASDDIRSTVKAQFDRREAGTDE